MKTEILKGHENYTCQVIELPAKQKVEGLDNLVKVTYQGNDCLIGKDSNEKELYLFFPAESCIEYRFLSDNNLFRDKGLNGNKDKSGFFEPSGRVKVLKFKGITSTGFIIPTSSLGTYGDKLKLGDELNVIDGVELCKKYKIIRTQSTVTNKKERINNKMVDLLVPNQLRFHNETSHLAKNLHLLNPDDIIVITDKWHGSSCILAHVLIKKKLSLWKRLLNTLVGNLDKEYGYIYSSGKPKSNLPKGIEGSWINDNRDYYESNIWKEVFDANKSKIEQGVSIYGEIVGFLGSGKCIQGGYDYGCDDNQHKFVVYRITYTKPDSSVIEYSWQQIKDYCKKYSLETVKELYFGNAWVRACDASGDYSSTTFQQDLFDFLSKFYLEKDCAVCINKVPSEGICVRIDARETYMTYKLKSKRFLERETKSLDKQEISIEDEN